MKPIRIIAWGNIGRCDDGVALVLAARLAARFASTADILVQEYHQLGPELVDDLDDCRLAIFIDAHAHAEGQAVTFDRVVPAESGGLDTHHCSPDALLGLTRALGQHVPDTWLIGIRGHNWDFGEALSEATQQAMLVAETNIIDLIGRS